MILNESADNESLENVEDFIHDTFFPESITITVRGRSSDLFLPVRPSHFYFEAVACR